MDSSFSMNGQVTISLITLIVAKFKERLKPSMLQQFSLLVSEKSLQAVRQILTEDQREICFYLIKRANI